MSGSEALDAGKERPPDGYSSCCKRPFWYGGPIHDCEVMRAEWRRLMDEKAASPPRRWWEFWRWLGLVPAAILAAGMAVIAVVNGVGAVGC